MEHVIELFHDYKFSPEDILSIYLYSYRYDSYINLPIRGIYYKIDILIRHYNDAVRNGSLEKYSEESTYGNDIKIYCENNINPIYYMFKNKIQNFDNFRFFLKCINDVSKSVYNNLVSISKKTEREIILYRGLNFNDKNDRLYLGFNSFTSCTSNINIAEGFTYGKGNKRILFTITIPIGTSIVPITPCSISEESEILVLNTGKLKVINIDMSEIDRYTCRFIPDRIPDFIEMRTTPENIDVKFPTNIKVGDRPSDIVIDKNGEIYVTNYGSNDISKITRDGKSSIYSKTEMGPMGILLDNKGVIYTCNSSVDNITIIVKDGKPTVYGITGSYPKNMSIDSIGNIYTANSLSNDVSKIMPNGDSIIIHNSEYVINNLIIDKFDNIYILTTHADSVLKIKGDGTIINRYFINGKNPRGICIDKDGNIYTANTDSNNVNKITPEGKITIIGTTGEKPEDITIDKNGNIYTCNSGSDNVTMISPDGESKIFSYVGRYPYKIICDDSNIYVVNNMSDDISIIKI